MRPTPTPDPAGHPHNSGQRIDRRKKALRWPFPHRLLPHGLSPAARATAAQVARRLYDHRPRNHPDGLTCAHYATIRLSELAAAMACSVATARRAIADLETYNVFQISRSPGRPILFRHRPDVAQLAEHGKAWMPWTNQPQPYRTTAVCYAAASWSDFNGNLNYEAIRKAGLTVTQALCERAGMTPPRLRTALTQLPTEGDIRTRTLRWLPRQMSGTYQDQHDARRIPAHPERPQPPSSAHRQRPEHTTTAEPPRHHLITIPRRQTPNKTDPPIYGLTIGIRELKNCTKQFRSPPMKKARDNAVWEVNWRTDQRTHPITNPDGLQAVLTWCYTRPPDVFCGRDHPGPCGREAMTLHAQRRTEQAFLERAQARKAAIAEAWGYATARSDGLTHLLQPPPVADEPDPPPVAEPPAPPTPEDEAAHENNMRRMKTGNPELYQILTRINATRKEPS